jgi:hypothetical protein
MSGGTQGTSPKSSDNDIEGARRDQKLAATMTPAAKPKEASKYLRLTVFVKKTTAAPTAVKPHVKSVAIKAWTTGCKPTRNRNIQSIFSHPENDRIVNMTHDLYRYAFNLLFPLAENTRAQIDN